MWISITEPRDEDSGVDVNPIPFAGVHQLSIGSSWNLYPRLICGGQPVQGNWNTSAPQGQENWRFSFTPNNPAALIGHRGFLELTVAPVNAEQESPITRTVRFRFGAHTDKLGAVMKVGSPSAKS